MQGIRGPGPRDWTEAAGVEGVPQATERAAQSPEDTQDMLAASHLHGYTDF